jgi:DNA-binding transcriptional MerR regulator
MSAHRRGTPPRRSGGLSALPTSEEAQVLPRVTIGRLAKLTDTTVDTIRFYERLGLLPKARRATSGYRNFDAEDVDRLRFIRRVRALGFNLDEIADILRLEHQGDLSGKLESGLEPRVREIERRIHDLTAIRDRLRQHAGKAKGRAKGRASIITELLGPDSYQTKAR